MAASRGGETGSRGGDGATEAAAWPGPAGS